ncbi:alpha/beta fold hydrolase [Actinoplanes sp. NPDC051411]|uniref:alpha/beta hydrolase n=1 Tax=Actinoplanes sp. NPDC051411 TaxID=3155522 RepID=UPI00344AE126
MDGIHVQRTDPEHRTHAAPLLLVHGGCHGAWCWDHYGAYFAGHGWQTHALSWRGHGRSAPLPEQDAVRRPLEDVAADIETVAAKLDTPPVIIAHSMGSLAALKYVERHPHSGLVLLTPAAPGEVSPPPIDVPFDLASMWGPPPFEISRQLFFGGNDDDEARAYYEMLVAESPRAVEQAVGDNRVSIDPVKISGPILMVSGELDQLTPAPDVRRMADFLGADYHYGHGFSHGVTLDPNWERLAHVVQTWLVSHAIPVPGEVSRAAA